MEKLQSTIERIKRMEQILDEITLISKTNPEIITTDVAVQEKLHILEGYLDSGQWMQDYECDERGELPADLKRGVLSEDALYNLLAEIKWNDNCQENISKRSETESPKFTRRKFFLIGGIFLIGLLMFSGWKLSQRSSGDF